MKRVDLRFRQVLSIFLAGVVIAACAPQASTPTLDVVGTVAAQLAADMLTQTAAAPTSTPLSPTETQPPASTDAPPEPPTEPPVPKPPAVIVFAGCWTGPGESYTLISNIDPGPRGRRVVTILGVGSVEGWIIIRNPYFNNPCWIRIENMQIESTTHLYDYPIMTPPSP